MPSPQVSVIVPFRSSPAELAGCLDCLARQTFDRRRLEVLAVNNGDPESSRSLEAAHSWVRWLQDPGLGSYSARNRGIAESQGAIIAFTDADCRPDPRWIECLAAALDRGEPTIMGGRVDMLGPPDQRPLNVYETYESLRFGLGDQSRSIKRKGFAATANLATFRHVVDRVGPFDGRLTSGGDRDWINRAVVAGEVLGYADDAIVRHPRRSTFVEISRKNRRVAGGAMFILVSRGASGMACLRELNSQSPLRWGTHQFALRGGGIRSGRRRLCFFLVAETLYFLATFERLRVLLGGRPQRT